MIAAWTILLVQLLLENIFWLFRDPDLLIADYQQCTMFLDNPLLSIKIVTKVLEEICQKPKCVTFMTKKKSGNKPDKAVISFL